MNIDMSSKNTKAKTVTKSQTTEEVKPEVKSEVKQTEPVQTQKTSKKSSKQVEQSQVVQQTEPEPVLTQKTNDKTSKKSSKTVEQPAQVVQQTESVPVSTQKTSKKSSKTVEQPAQVVQQTESVPTQKAGKKSSEQTESEPVVEQSQKIEVEEDCEQEGRLRYFKLFYNDAFQGRYCGKKPKQAANKAFSSIVKEMRKTDNQKGGVDVNIAFSIRECTRNSKHKEYKYVGVREELEKPVKVLINNDDGTVKEITYNFHNKIQK